MSDAETLSKKPSAQAITSALPASETDRKIIAENIKGSVSNLTERDIVKIISHRGIKGVL